MKYLVIVEVVHLAFWQRVWINQIKLFAEMINILCINLVKKVKAISL